MIVAHHDLSRAVRALKGSYETRNLCSVMANVVLTPGTDGEHCEIRAMTYETTVAVQIPCSSTFPS